MRNINNKEQNREGSKVIAGVIIVAVGVALLLRNIGFLLPHWLFTWPMILILVGIYTGFKHNFRNNSWLIVTGIGAFFLIQKFIPSLHLEPYFWPLIIIAIGIIYILNPSKKFCKNRKQTISNDKLDVTATTSWQGFTKNKSVDSNDEFKISSIFSGVKRNIITKNFKQGQITCIFGGAEIDMTQADMQDSSVIRLDIAFGGVEILVPANWVVQNEIQGMFHGVEDKRYNNVGTIDASKMLILRGSCLFGGVEIKSY
jgi:predicted membrane protein